MSGKISFGSVILRRLRRDRSGVAVPLVAVSAVVLFGMAGFVIDVGAAYETRLALQATTDAAALAGAQDINCSTCSATQPVTTATKYSSTTGNLNVIGHVTATMAAGYPLLKCFTSTGASCNTPSKANGIVVKQTASVPTTFSRVLGINQFNITTTSTAGAQGGISKPLNVMIVLDTTASMNDPDTACGKNTTKLQCAEEGVQVILQTLSSKVDNIGLMVFPGLLPSVPVSEESNCNGQIGKSQLAEYGATGATKAPVYQVVPLSNNYNSGSGSSYTINTSSSLANAVGAGGSGLCAPGGMGTYFADAITAAQAALVAWQAANPNTPMQGVIILLSDGDASATSGSQIVASEATNQCHEAITAAQAATTAKTWVYSLAYQALSTGCSTDKPAISPCTTMQDIASDASKFYSDNSSCVSTNNQLSGLVNAFSALAQSLLPPRLLPDGTT